MTTNYGAQVKMPPKPQASQAPRDVVAVSSSLGGGPVNKATNPRPVAGFHRVSDLDSSHSTVGLQITTHQTGRIQSRAYTFSKRTFDLLLGSVMLVIAIPIVAVAAAAIRINTPGSPFFFQTRLGKNGKPFRIFKLRGMYVDAHQRFPSYYDYSKKQDLEFCFHYVEDPRVTRAGKFIRKTSIDELPNLWNVITGDMSLVGPRPEIPEVLALYGPYHDQYLSVKPGITCLSKCTGRDTLTKRETVEFDLDYIRRQSFLLDMKILWRTFRAVVLRRDVF